MNNRACTASWLPIGIYNPYEMPPVPNMRYKRKPIKIFAIQTHDGMDKHRAARVFELVHHQDVSALIKNLDIAKIPDGCWIVFCPTTNTVYWLYGDQFTEATYQIQETDSIPYSFVKRYGPEERQYNVVHCWSKTATGVANWRYAVRAVQWQILTSDQKIAEQLGVYIESVLHMKSAYNPVAGDWIINDPYLSHLVCVSNNMFVLLYERD